MQSIVARREEIRASASGHECPLESARRCHGGVGVVSSDVATGTGPQSLAVTARIFGIVVYGFDFEWIFRPVIRSFGIWTFTPRDDAIEPHSTLTHRESLPVAPYVLLGSIQN